MAKIFALDYRGRKAETSVDESEVKRIEVTVLTGDECLKIETKNGDSFMFDIFADNRWKNCYDGSYSISPEDEDFQKWMNRTGAYAFCPDSDDDYDENLGENYIVTFEWQEDWENHGSIILACFNTRDAAADYILKSTGMRINDDYYVTIAQDQNYGSYCEMRVYRFDQNDPPPMINFKDCETPEDANAAFFTDGWRERIYEAHFARKT